MQVGGRQHNNFEIIAVGHLAGCADLRELRPNQDCPHRSRAREISQIIASGSLGWATACIGHTELCASFIEMFGQMLWVWLKGPENRSRCEIAPNMSITWPITWPITLPIT